MLSFEFTVETHTEIELMLFKFLEKLDLQTREDENNNRIFSREGRRKS